jgi:ElaB/YqjD/DUF883 family membrane-anchored ribosome-binding protein
MTKEEIQARLQDIIDEATLLVKDIGTEAKARVREAVEAAVAVLNDALAENQEDAEG